MIIVNDILENCIYKEIITFLENFLKKIYSFFVYLKHFTILNLFILNMRL